ncbi:MAG: glycosyltransferase 87 family protein [Candidatus Dormibacteria bacterium]
MGRWLRILWFPILVLAVVPLLLTEAGFFPIHNLVGSAILDVIYLSHGAFGLAHGHVPYAPLFMTYPDQHLAFLYPPLTLLLALPPVLAGSLYAVAFSIEILILVLLGSLVLGTAVRRAGMTSPVALVTAALLLAVGPVLLTRVDAIQGLMVAGSAVALMRRRHVWAVALVALAVLIKETAVLAAVPVGLWCLFPGPGEKAPLRRRLEEVALGLLPAFLIFAFFAVWSHGGEVTSALASVHRGLEIESVPGSVAIMLGHFFRVRPYFGHLASWQLATPVAGLLAGAFTAAGAVVIIAGAVLFARQHRHPATAISFCVAVGLCSTPVLSPQYLLDLLPVLAVAACLEFPPRRGAQIILLGLVMALLTQAEFPALFGSVVKLQPLGVSLLLVRNLLLIVTAVLLAGRARGPSEAAPAPNPAAPAIVA